VDRRSFLERVLPLEGGDYFGMAISEKRAQQFKFGSISELNTFLEQHKKTKNLYFGTGVFDGRRTISSTKLKKSLYLDLDCGEGPNKYATKRDAAIALSQWYTHHFIKPSIVVDSGGGIHAYWTFDTAVSLTRWQAMADEFKQRCINGGLVIDPAVPADGARVMRAPNTLNHKRMAVARILSSKEHDYSPEKIEDALGLHRRATLALVVNNDDLFGGVKFNQQEWSAAKMIAGCPMYADAYSTGGADLPEMLWTQQLHVLAYCKDGEDWVHEISKSYKGYSAPETQMKWNQRLQHKNRVGPTKCETFSQWSPHCQTCPHKAHITTPLQLGSARDISLPYPYNQDERGVFLNLTKHDSDGNEITDRIEVFPYPVSNFTVLHTADDVIARFDVDVAGTTKNAEVPLTSIQDRKSCVVALARSQVVLHYGNYTFFRDFMSAWIKKMQDAKAVQASWKSLGWVDSPKGFVLADKVVVHDGTEIPNLNPDRVLSSLFTPKGDRRVVKATIQHFTKQGRFASDSIVLSAFAGPLMEFIADSSAVLSFVSAKSGSGKSTAMELAQAVWGSPKDAMNQLDDTYASVLKKLAYLKHIPAYWDEIKSGNDVQRLVRTIFQLTGGKERGRLTANIELRDVGSWNTMLVTASNESLASHASFVSKDSEAGRARVFEVTVPTITEDERDPLIGQLMIRVRKNYGHLGQEYAAYLAANRASVEATVRSVHEALSKKLQTDSAERFWIATMAALLTALGIARKLGYVSTDPKAYQKWLIAKFEAQKQDKGDSFGEPDARANEVLNEFLSEFRTQIGVYDRLPATGEKAGRVHHLPDRGEVVAAIGLEKNVLRFSKKVFTAWLYERGSGSPNLLMQQIPHAIVVSKLVPSVDGLVGARLKCYEVDIPGELVAPAPDPTEFED